MWAQYLLDELYWPISHPGSCVDSVLTWWSILAQFPHPLSYMYVGSVLPSGAMWTWCLPGELCGRRSMTQLCSMARSGHTFSLSEQGGTPWPSQTQSARPWCYPQTLGRLTLPQSACHHTYPCQCNNKNYLLIQYHVFLIRWKSCWWNFNFLFNNYMHDNFFLNFVSVLRRLYMHLITALDLFK